MEPKVTVEQWDKRWEVFERINRDKLDRYSKYCDWFNNDFDSTVAVAGSGSQIEKAQVTTINMVSRIVIAWMSWVYQDQPRMVAKPEAGMSEKLTSLADIFTAVGNDIATKTNLYAEGERIAQDSGMSPFFVAKIGYDATIALDEDELKEEREKAREENELMKAGEKIQPQKDEYHSAHIEYHDNQIELRHQREVYIDIHAKVMLIEDYIHIQTDCRSSQCCFSRILFSWLY